MRMKKFHYHSLWETSMNLAVKAVAFDLDGTLINSAKGLAEAVDQTLVELGYEAVGFNQVSVWIGHGAINLVETALQHIDPLAGIQKFEAGFSLFTKFYTEILKKGSEVYPHVYETLDALKSEGYQLALVTNKPSRFLPTLLAELKMTEYFDLVLGADDVAARKPHPAPIFMTLGHFGIRQDELLFVGDSKNDIDCAKDAGVRTVGVTYGYNFGRSITAENPTFVISDMLELLPIVSLFSSVEA